MASKNINYLWITLMKDVQDRHTKKYQTPLRKIQESHA